MDGVKIVMFLLCVSSSTAFIFRRRPTMALAEGSVNETCLSLAELGSCEFYTCFENRFRCGRNWYMVRMGQHYCHKLDRHRSRFTSQGQLFINITQRCLTMSLQEHYQRDNIDCSELEDDAIESIAPCFVENAFCDVFEENADHFFEVYEFSDLFSIGAERMWQAIVSLAARCGHEALREFSSSAGETLINTLNDVLNSIGNSIININ